MGERTENLTNIQHKALPGPLRCTTNRGGCQNPMTIPVWYPRFPGPIYGHWLPLLVTSLGMCQANVPPLLVLSGMSPVRALRDRSGGQAFCLKRILLGRSAVQGLHGSQLLRVTSGPVLLRIYKRKWFGTMKCPKMAPLKDTKPSTPALIQQTKPLSWRKNCGSPWSPMDCPCISGHRTETVRRANRG